MSPAITTPHPLATAAGQEILAAGGTAAEAIIAAGAVLTVVMPHFCGIGGDAVWLLVDRRGQKSCLLAIGQGIARPPVTGAIPQRGPGSVLTTAAVVDGWGRAHALSTLHWGGRLRFGDLMQPAIGLAESGFVISASQKFWRDFRASEAEDWPGFAQHFPRHAIVQRQPDLARSLREIAEHGPRSFYEGLLAQRIVAGLRAAGVVISLDDLARTRSRECVPLELPYRDLTLLAPPAPTQGAVTLAIMGILERFELSALAPGSADHLHLCVEAVKRAFLSRDGIADPRFAPDRTSEMIAPARLNKDAEEIDLHRALPWPAVWQAGDTVFLAAHDAHGNAASVLQSTYFDWGSGVIAGDTGILWQNRGAAFSHDPAHPNAFAPGKLPFYTLNPGMALREGRPRFLYGTQGADGQPQTLAMLLTRLIDFKETPEAALRGPRFLLGRTFSDSRDSLKIEADAGPALAALQSRGHEVSPIPELSPLSGQAGVIALSREGAVAAHDPRGEGEGVVISPVECHA
ncbi:gamma-glutamyltransferase family protein [Haematobacter genomosp. 1]|uniref:Gamma-glutamyltransferase n=1 Tax=Haematobacter genomosp. 1 TaxID=366618 RepID=A0A212ABH4_9RHOB|nr:gamma-glutamyltransferase [Haematobacter genomosp. 1]OWJ77935.1 gamma-glutamyltransferase [Haematobacter genomosp. 1]